MKSFAIFSTFAVLGLASACPTGSIPDASGVKCCAASCGTCGGYGCDKRPGGSSACCTGSVTTSCTLGYLPCVINGTPTTTPTTAPSSNCPPGSIADSSGTRCCPSACGLCGGLGCDKRPGGDIACCTGSITLSCTLGVLPCVINGTPTPTTAPTNSPSSCPSGSIADASGVKCCAASCGLCGGYGCDSRPGGAAACCTGSVTKSCTLGSLPCVVNGAPTTAPTTAPSSCPPGSITDATGTKCCAATCGICGGYGCDARPGGDVALLHWFSHKILHFRGPSMRYQRHTHDYYAARAKLPDGKCGRCVWNEMLPGQLRTLRRERLRYPPGWGLQLLHEQHH
eukprot:CAMPEP_0171461176 /NCGR_PEP_ID=MMETSP0945-20130129/5734_1 /TAXON_ID=109269 /ORGANISM="Vaucheria litorea, Strain CCMP2940" /LENGTH=339 /DNA_ID=CAMNT_0011987481 /DNA_START=42 /DNA_END=1060 /DNA_ORIENTATION=+